MLKNLPANEGDLGVSGSIPGLGRSARVGNGIPFQYSCLENSTDKELMWYSPWGHKESDATEGDLLQVTPMRDKEGSRSGQRKTSENNADVTTMKEIRAEERPSGTVPTVLCSSPTQET